MSIITAPDPTASSYPTPQTCEAWRYDPAHPCGAPATVVCGVTRSCGCPSTLRAYACDWCFSLIPHGDLTCRFCFTNGTCTLLEPVRLRGAASDGRTE